MEQPAKPRGIWTKVDYNRVFASPTTSDASEAKEDEDDQRARRWGFRFLDTLGGLFWLYVTLKVFVTDIDADIFGSAAQYRFFVFLGIAAVLVLMVRSTMVVLVVFAYILGFPLVVVFWKLPHLLYKSGSPIAFLAAVNAVTSVLADMKHSIVVGAAVAFAALSIAVGHNHSLLWTSGGAMLALLVQAMYRTIRLSVVPTRFVRLQQRGIKRTFEAQFVHNMLAPGEELRGSDVQKFSETQQNTFLQGLGMAVLAQRALSWWAYQLENYRKSPATIMFNSLSYLWLLLRAILALAFLNLALYHGNPHAYTYDVPPTFFVMIRYVIAGLYGGEIQALHPQSDLANGLSIIGFTVGIVVLGFLALSSFLSFRATRDESELQLLIRQIRHQGDALDARVREEYEVTVPEAIQQLQQLKWGLTGLVVALSSRIPQDIEETSDSRDTTPSDPTAT